MIDRAGLDPRIFEPVRRHRHPGDPPANLTDEVWDGVYQEMPLWDIEHQSVRFAVAVALTEAVDDAGRGKTYAGVNVSSIRGPGSAWRTDYRCPDVAVYLTENPARDRGSHWYGGPDLALEIVSRGDRSRQKLGFYAAVGVRELFVIDRDPWALELYRLRGEELRSAGVTRPGGDPLRTEAVPLRWSLTDADPPAVSVTAAESSAPAPQS